MTTRLKKMKGMGAVLGFAALIICSPAEGAQAVSIITPIITEFAIDLWPKIASSVKSLTKQEGQCKACSRTGGLACTAGIIKSACKSRCQERVEMGSGYILKIRYAGKWNMRTCMEAQKKACLKTAGKGKKPAADCSNPPSAAQEVAVYNAQDLKIARELITKIVASDHIIARNGAVEPKITQHQAEQERNQALRELTDKFSDQDNAEPVNLEAVKTLITKIVNHQMILDSYGKEAGAAKPASPQEKLQEAQEERDRAIAQLAKLRPDFGPQ